MPALQLPFPAMAMPAHTHPANRGIAFGLLACAVDIGFGVCAISMGMIAEAWDYKTVFVLVGSYTILYTISYHFWLRRKISNIVT